MKIPLQIEVYGESGVGKTYFCTTSPNPVLIDVSPTAESKVNAILSGCKYFQCASLQDVRDAVEFAKDENYSSVCIDPSIYLQPLAVEEWLVEENAQRRKADKSLLTSVYPFQRYGDVRRKVDDIFTDVIGSEMNLICTSQMQDYYDGDKKTGKRVPAGYSKLDFQSHIRLRIAIIANKRVCFVRKNRFVDVLSEKYFKKIPDPSFNCLLDNICNATGLDKDTFIIGDVNHDRKQK